MHHSSAPSDNKQHHDAGIQPPRAQAQPPVPPRAQAQPPVPPRAQAQPPVPPRAQSRPLDPPRSFHGDSFADPFQWLRCADDPAVIDLVEKENAWADHVTAPLRALSDTLVSEFKAHTVETDVTVPIRIGQYWYFDRTEEGSQYVSHQRVPVTLVNDESPAHVDAAPLSPPTIHADRPAPGEETVIDENAQAAGEEFFSVGEWAPSPDGTRVAWLKDTSGDERYTLVVTDIASGRTVDEQVTNVGYGVAWSADSASVLYTRVDDAWRACQVWLHVVGEDPAHDRRLLDEPDERFEVYFEQARDPNWVVITSASTSTSEVWLWPTLQPHHMPVSVTGRRPGVLVSAEPAGDHLLLIHTADSREGSLAIAPLPQVRDEGGAAESVDYSTWHTLIEGDSQGPRLLDVEAYESMCVISMRRDGQTWLEYMTRTAPTTPEAAAASARQHRPDYAQIWSEPRAVLPGAHDNGAVLTMNTVGQLDWHDRLILVECQSITQPPRTVAVDPRDGSAHVLREKAVPGWDAEQRAGYVEERVWVTARDGHTRIPVTLVHRRDAACDGRAAGWLYGYGSYEISNDPEFSVLRLPAIQRGVVFALAHIRGGGEMGRWWYEDGRREVKTHTFTDFIDVGRFLVDAGWVAPHRLIAEGRSAGGLLMGAVTNMAPDLFRVILAGVPFVDALTSILDPSLPLTVGEWEEWGNPIEDREIYTVMKSYSPYENVADGVEYPAIMASTSINDTRVLFGEPLKWVQRLRQATAGNTTAAGRASELGSAAVTTTFAGQSDPTERPIIMRTQMVAGHRGPSGRYGHWASRAEEFAFALSQVGINE
ncbi:MAG: prolyl oligopeptidase family serine peptidase [Actinomyces sp.]|nr:prolyl oligopeptidase family serine peptidase [Actinomyces sp.]